MIFFLKYDIVFNRQSFTAVGFLSNYQCDLEGSKPHLNNWCKSLLIVSCHTTQLLERENLDWTYTLSFHVGSWWERGRLTIYRKLENTLLSTSSMFSGICHLVSFFSISLLLHSCIKICSLLVVTCMHKMRRFFGRILKVRVRALNAWEVVIWSKSIFYLHFHFFQIID